MVAEYRRAAFLDRDGTVIEERGYLADPARVRLIEGAPRAIARLAEAGLAVVMVTNQSGIGRSLYTDEDYRAVQGRLERMLRERGAELHGVYHCPHDPDAGEPCVCRKPGPGMYRAAARDLDLTLAGSYYVGDKRSDVAPAIALGGTGILVRTGYGVASEAGLPEGVLVAADLLAAAGIVLRLEASIDPSEGLE